VSSETVAREARQSARHAPVFGPGGGPLASAEFVSIAANWAAVGALAGKILGQALRRGSQGGLTDTAARIRGRSMVSLF